MRWLTVPLGDVAEVAAGGGAPQDQADFGSEGYPFVRAGSLKALISGGDTAPLERLAPATAATHKLRLFPANTVLFAKSGMSAAIGLVHRLQWPAYVVNHLAAVMCGEQLDSAFLHHYLRAFSPSRLIQDAAYPSIRLGDIAGMKVPLPSIQDQRRIAAILDQADVLRAKRREALALLDELQRGIFIEMFGDQSSLGWPEVSLGEVTDTLTGFAFRSEEYVECNTEAVRLCRGVNVLPGRIDWSDTAWWPLRKVIGLEKFGLAVGDVVLAMDRPWISEGFKITRVSERDCPSLLVQRVTRIRGGELADEKFIYHLLKQPAFAHHCKPTETTVPHISPKEIRSYKFRLPPVALQTDFSRRIGFVEKLLDSMNAALVCSDALFATLQHRAFRGEL